MPLSGRRCRTVLRRYLAITGATAATIFQTRVPVTLNEAKQAVATIGAQPLTALGNGYHGRWQHANYAGVAQRWLLVRSEQASHREQQTLAPKPAPKDKPASSKPSPIVCPTLACEAMPAELSCFTASLMLLQLDAEAVGEPAYTGRGSSGEEPMNFKSLGWSGNQSMQEARTTVVHPGDQTTADTLIGQTATCPCSRMSNGLSVFLRPDF